MTVRTRFAPSPTGFIHLGNIRSALYPWAFAKSQGGTFILRIEDTDTERSSQAAVDVILEGMDWLGMSPDEGPFYQMQRMDRYREVLGQLKAAGHIYPCYMSSEELDALRERQKAAKQKPRYDGTWRPVEGKTLPAMPDGVQPVWRFKTPLDGTVAWDDKVKGRIEISNAELDDLIVARADGTPTYNFCVVVDDLDMGISHVIRGDDHVNNTPRQIHIFNALGKPHPVYAHLPTVLNEQGDKMSKRAGAKAVTQYRDEGFLPDAMLNYLARLGWSHGDDEIFSREQFLEWFDLEHLGKSASQYDEAKLRWVNAEYIKQTDDAALADYVKPMLETRGVQADARLQAVCALFKDRCATTVELADWVQAVYQAQQPDPTELEKMLAIEGVPAAIARFAEQASAIGDADWSVESVKALVKATLKECGLKMPHLAKPLRAMVIGTANAPSVDAVLHLVGRDEMVRRLKK